MRWFLLLTTCLVLAGCEASANAPQKGQRAETNVESDTVLRRGQADRSEGSEQVATLADEAPKETDDAASSSETTTSRVPSLWTRKRGVDWPCFLGPTGDSKSPEKGILTEWPPTGPRIVWQRKIGEGYAIGSVSAGRFFQPERVGNRARLVCLNAETGEELWTHEYPTDYTDMYGYDGGPRCSPVVDDDRVYMYGAEGMLYCLETTTGKEIWEIDTFKEFGVVQNFFGVGSTPVVEGDLLIVMVGGSSPDSQGLPLDRVEANGSAIVAFNKHTGKVVYKLGNDLASYASLKLATIDDRRWCFAFCREGLLGFEPRAGKVDFHYPWRAKTLESVNASMPVVDGNQVFISETYGPGSSLLEVIPGDYRVVWADDLRMRQKAMQTHWNTPVLVDGTLYGSSGRHTENAELRAIDWKTGKVLWSEPGLTRTSLLYVDGHLISLGEYGQLQLLKANPEKYDLVAEVLLRSDDGDLRLPGAGAPPLLRYPAWAAPILSHGLLYVRGEGRLVCLELIPDA